MIHVKRIYEPPLKDDGLRILVERLWPRGFTKEQAALDLWLKEIAPSSDLRKWFAHDMSKWEEFRKQYRSELKENKKAVDQLKDYIARGTVTLIYSARDERHNGAVVLKEFLERL